MAPHDDRTCWLVRAGDGGRATRPMVTGGVVAVGEEWSGVGDLLDADDADVYTALEAAGRRKPADDLVQARIMSSRMAAGDIVVVLEGGSGDILFGDVVGDYAYVPEATGGDVHQRPVTWFGRLSGHHLEPFLVKAVSWKAGRVRRLPEQVHWLRVAGEVRDGLGRPAEDFPRTAAARVSRGGTATRTRRAPAAAAAPKAAVQQGVPQQLCPSCGLLRAASLFDDGDDHCRDCA